MPPPCAAESAGQRNPTIFTCNCAILQTALCNRTRCRRSSGSPAEMARHNTNQEQFLNYSSTRRPVLPSSLFHLFLPHKESLIVPSTQQRQQQEHKKPFPSGATRTTTCHAVAATPRLPPSPVNACLKKEAMEMASARRRGKPSGGDTVLWGACVLLSSLSLLIAAVSSRFGAARLTGEVSALVRVTTTNDGESVVGRWYCGDDDLSSMSVDGEWVRDDDAERHYYQPGQCPFVDAGFRCRENGRPDGDYARWRWRPRRCTLPRFDAAKLLRVLRNRRLVFVGDSIGRNQWESMLCMLSSSSSGAEGEGSAVYEENGNPITKHKGFLSFRFPDHNCTVEHFRSPYLVRRGRPPRRSPKRVESTIQVSAMDGRARQWKDADVLVFNTGHWWNQERLRRLGCYFQDGKKLQLNMSVEDAYQRAMSTLQKWIHKEVNPNKILVVLRTYSPAHTRIANSGGCAAETSPELNTSKISLDQWPGMLNPAFQASPNISRTAATRMQVLNVTLMTAQRRDAHPSVYNVGPSSRTPTGQRADCSHWCLPGVPDAWNELLYAVIMKRFS